MAATISQRSTPTMASTRSNGGSLSGPSMPFTKTSHTRPSLQTVDTQPGISAIDAWKTGHDDPYSLHRHQLSRSLSQTKQDPERGINNVGERPDEYFARFDMATMLPVSPAPIDIPNTSQWRNSNHRGSTSSQRRPSFGIATPTTPSSAALTTGSTFASEMSRQSSLCNDAFSGTFAMMNVQSENMFFSDNNSIDERSYQSGIPLNIPSPYTKLCSSDEQALLLAGTGGAGEDAQFQLSFQGHTASTPQFSSQPSFIEDMERSQSNESNSSSVSATSRATTMLKRQNQLATRPLAPKANGDELAMSREGSRSVASIKSKDSLENRAVAQIAKAPYQRPKHDRVYCDQCNECPEGFRGAHELGRHRDRQHKDQVKKWMCVEPLGDVDTMPVNPLSGCKSCSQKKKYGAYYNAAAHLRRAHFKPKTRGRNKSTKTDEKSEKRGGKGGGTWPPMSVLKLWMKDIHEVASESQQDVVDDGEEEVEEDDHYDINDDDCSGSFENDDDYANFQGASNTSSAGSNFDGVYVYNDTTMIDAYQTPTSNPSTQNMQYDNVALPQSIDLLIAIDSSQPSFAESQSVTNDHVSLIDHFHQSFDHQSFDHQQLCQDSFLSFRTQM